MLKRMIENLDGLHEAIASLYKKGADNKFHLEVEDDGREELVRAKEHEVGLRKIADRDLGTARAELDAANVKVADLTRSQQTGVAELRTQLEADYGTQITKLKDSHVKEKDTLERSIKKVFVHDVASGIAKEIAVDAGAAELLVDVIQRRLTVEIVDGEPVTRVLSADGKASSMTPDQLKTEYFTNEKYARIMRASDASGGGASGGGKGGGASKTLDGMSEPERNKMAREQPEQFQRLVDAQKSAPV